MSLGVFRGHGVGRVLTTSLRFQGASGSGFGASGDDFWKTVSVLDVLVSVGFGLRACDLGWVHSIGFSASYGPALLFEVVLNKKSDSECPSNKLLKALKATNSKNFRLLSLTILILLAAENRCESENDVVTELLASSSFYISLRAGHSRRCGHKRRAAQGRAPKPPTKTSFFAPGNSK